MENPEITSVTIPKVLKMDMTFRGELLASESCGGTIMEVYRIHPHPKPGHPSNVHSGKFIVILHKDEKNSYIHCATPQEVVNALHQPWDDGSYNFTQLSKSVFNGLVSCEPENFKNCIAE